MDSTIRPRFSLLREEQIEYVHSRSLEILSTTGLRIDSRLVMEVLRASDGVHVKTDLGSGTARVVFEEDLVSWAIETAPAEVDIYDRRGELAFRLGKNRTRFGVGVTNLHYQDPLTDEPTPFLRKHMGIATRLGHDLPNFDVVSTIGILQDLPPNTADLYAVLEMVANTTKPLILLTSDDASFEPTLDLLETLQPGMADSPFTVPYLNPVTPLVINESTGHKLITSIQRGLPVIYSNFSMAGASTPITAAGTLVLLNAELMAGLVVAQLTRPGTPVILGSLPAFFDMRTMQDFYDPHSMLLNVACAEMMAHYGLPHAGTSGSGIGWGVDLPAGGLFWINHLLSLLGKSGLAPFVGGTLHSKAFSPVLVVYSNDVIAQVLRLTDGFPLGDRELDLETIHERGPGANFLDSELTLSSFRGAYYDSKLTPRPSLEEWESRGQPRFEDLLRRHTVQLLADSGLLEDHDELIAKGEAFIAELS